MKNFKKYYKINATPEEVYNALVNPNLIEIWTDSEVIMSEEVGSEFSLYDGDLVGKNLEFEKNKKLVQQWYFGEEGPESIVTIKLHEDKYGTSVELNHTNIPDEAYDNISTGWTEGYFGSILDLFEEE
jgi:activator of HSP90 ATPase